VELLDRAADIEGCCWPARGLGNLRIGATLTIGNYLATLIVAEFLRRHPLMTNWRCFVPRIIR
jgi:DNA-binding transcriptional LysR family regulator